MLDIISREGWKAKDALRPQPLNNPINTVFFGYSRYQECTGHLCRTFVLREQVKQQAYRGISDIAYSFMIENRGLIFEGRGLQDAPALPSKYKHLEQNSLFIVFLGSFKEHPPGDIMFQAREDFLHYLIKNEIISTAYRLIVI